MLEMLSKSLIPSVSSVVPASTCYGPIYSTAHTVALLAIQNSLNIFQY